MVVQKARSHARGQLVAEFCKHSKGFADSRMITGVCRMKPRPIVSGHHAHHVDHIDCDPLRKPHHAGLGLNSWSSCMVAQVKHEGIQMPAHMLHLAPYRVLLVHDVDVASLQVGYIRDTGWSTPS